MGRIKKWDGYSSWSYLEPGIDFTPYEIEKQIDRFPEYDFNLSKTQKERVEELMEKNIVIDLHEHLNVFPLEGPRTRRRLYKGFEGLAFSGVDVVFEGGALYTGPLSGDWVVDYLGMSLCDYAHQNLVTPAFKVDDIKRAHKEGKVAVIMSIENLNTIGHNIDMIDLYYGLGLRQAGLASYASNTLGTDASEHVDGGLSDLGYDVVKRMNKTGMIIDVSHCSDLTASEAIEASDKPIIITHAGSRTLFWNMRMFPDEILKAMAEKGGVIGVEIAGFAPRTKEHPEATIECMLDHIKHLIEVLGADHVGVGPDTFWGDHPGMYREGGETRLPRPSDTRSRNPILPPKFSTYELRAKTPLEMPYCMGFENPGDFRNIVKGLVRDGYSDNEIAKVIGSNGLRVIKACWPH